MQVLCHMLMRHMPISGMRRGTLLCDGYWCWRAGQPIAPSRFGIYLRRDCCGAWTSTLVRDRVFVVRCTVVGRMPRGCPSIFHVSCTICRVPDRQGLLRTPCTLVLELV